MTNKSDQGPQVKEAAVSAQGDMQQAAQAMPDHAAAAQLQGEGGRAEIKLAALSAMPGKPGTKKISAKKHKADDEEEEVAGGNGAEKSDDADADAAEEQSAAQGSSSGGGEMKSADAGHAQAGGGSAGGSSASWGAGLYVLGAAAAAGGGLLLLSGGDNDDGGAPVKPVDKVSTPSLALKTDTGASASDFVTQHGTINVAAITGTNSWEYSTNNGSTWTAGTGTSFTLAEGSYAAGAVQVRQKDATGQTSDAAKIANAIVVDKTAASAPVINAVAQNDVVSQTEAQAPVVVSGTAEAGSSVRVTWGATVKTVTAGTDGTWSTSFAVTELPVDGSYTITATATDLAGNVSVGGGRPISVDTSNYVTGQVVAGPVIAGIEITAYKEDGTLLGSGVTDASGAFRIAFKGYTGLALFAAKDPLTDSRGFIDEATGQQADISVLLRAVANVTAGQDVVINISPFTEVATRLMSPGLSVAGTTTITGTTQAQVDNANATVSTLFTDSSDGILVSQAIKLIIDSTGADTSASANIYGVYLAAVQGWAAREGLTLEQAIEQIVNAIPSTALGAETTLGSLGAVNGAHLAEILNLGFQHAVTHNPALANAQFPEAALQQLGMIDDASGPSFEGGPSISVSIAETAAVGSLVHTSKASDVAGVATYSLAWGPDQTNMSGIDINTVFNIDPQTGAIELVSGVDYELMTTYHILVSIKDFWGNESSQAVTVNVTNVNEAPVALGGLVDQNVYAGQPFSYTVPAVNFFDPDGDTLSYSAMMVNAQGALIDLPVWLDFDPQTGKFSSTSAPVLTEPLTIRVTASDGTLSASEDLTLTGISAPVITSVTTPVAIAKQGDSVTIVVTFSEDVVYPSDTASRLYLDLNGDGAYDAIAEFDYGVTLGLQNSTQMAFELITPAGNSSNIKLTSVDLPNVVGMQSSAAVQTAELNQIVEHGSSTFVIDNLAATLNTVSTFAAENGFSAGTLTASETVSWELDGTGGSNSLFSLSPAGVLTLNAPKNYEADPLSYVVNVRMKDAAGNESTGSVTVNLTDVNETPVLTQALDDQSVVQGQSFSYVIPSASFQDPESGALTYSAQLVTGQGTLAALPSWLSFDAQTATFSSSSAPALANSLVVRVTASDGTNSVTDDFKIAQQTVPVFSTLLNGVTNLDVRSDLVFTSSEGFNLTTVDGTYEIRIVNTANTTAKAGYSGTVGEAMDNSQTITINVVNGMALASVNGVAANVADLFTVAGNKLIINPHYDLDFSNNYQVEIDAGLFQGINSGLGSAAMTSGAVFSTVTPNTTGAGAAIVTGGAASQMMASDGSLIASHKWVGIDNVGNTAVASATSIGSLAADGYALVVSDRDATDAIGTWDFWVRATGFGADDLVYLDNQQNGSAGWDLANTSFASGDSDPNDTRVEFGTYNAAAPFPNSSQSYIDLDIGGEWRETPDAVQTYLQSPTPLFAGG